MLIVYKEEKACVKSEVPEGFMVDRPKDWCNRETEKRQEAEGQITETKVQKQELTRPRKAGTQFGSGDSLRQSSWSHSMEDSKDQAAEF